MILTIIIIVLFLSRFAESMILRKIASPKKILISLQIGIFITFIAYAFYISGVANGFKSLSPNSDEIDYQNPVFIVTENPLPINFVRKAINYTNVQTTVYNEQLYGPLTNDHPVIIVQVHNRIFYLNYLIASLADVKGINKALLIFSHDIYNEEINTLIQNIKFCKVITTLITPTISIMMICSIFRFYKFSIPFHCKLFLINSRVEILVIVLEMLIEKSNYFVFDDKDLL